MSAPPARRSIVVATRNQHKLAELEEILDGYELHALPDDVVLPPEVGESFAANAREKALAAHRASGAAVIADDSGIEARALGGLPGVRSARFAGPAASDEQNLNHLLHELDGSEDRSVAYVCVLVHVSADGEETIIEGRCEGTLAKRPRGQGGFGYDPAFIPADVGDGRTMAEIDPAHKHAISHRGRAARAMAEALSQGGS
ncbi:MAG: RdgB/HAM1 family non-canonical purine NTP pyrophosphatase [Solirubrobacterales bacterium]